jgi:hypothetical protein
MNKSLFAITAIFLIVSALFFLHPMQTSQGIVIICPKCYLLGASRVLGKNGQLFHVVAASRFGDNPIKLLLSNRPNASASEWVKMDESEIQGRVVFLLR